MTGTGRPPTSIAHPRLPRREFLRVGGLGLLGFGLADLLRREAKASATNGCSVIYLFQSGGPAQHETWDLKPDAPSAVRGEFNPIDTATPGMQICEHLPELAKRSDRFALLRSFSHASNDHSLGHHIMLTGYEPMPVGFDPNRPSPNDWPSLATVVNYALRDRARRDAAVGRAAAPAGTPYRTGDSGPDGRPDGREV